MAIGPPLALIAGPTASGKSALALALAEQSGGVIVNADSAQIYRDLPVLSAAPTAAETRRAEHRLYTAIDGATACSAPEWAAMARRAISEVHAGTSPEEKLTIVRQETARAKTVFIGDGINDAPALTAATVGIAFGRHSDVTTEAARVVIADSSLARVDELMHISYRLRRIALQSAVGGMVLSVAGMGFAAAGLMGPVAGAVAQEAIDVVAVLNALRTARVPRSLTDFEPA
jgi:hypothetical protein